MTRLLDVLKALTLGIAILVGASVFLLLLQVSSAVKHTDAALSGSLEQLNGIAQVVQSTAQHLDRLIDSGGKLVGDGRLSLDNLNHAAIDERFYFERDLPKLMDQAHGILGNVQVATADLDPLLTEATDRVRDVSALENGAADVLADVDHTARDPNIDIAIRNLAATSSELALTARESAGTMASVESMAFDGQQEVHKLTHPRPLITIADWTLKVVHAIGGWF